MTDYRTMDDVSRDSRRRDVDEFVEDINEAFEKIFPKKLRRKFTILKWSVKLFLLLFLVTIILGCVWLINFFVRGVF